MVPVPGAADMVKTQSGGGHERLGGVMARPLDCEAQSVITLPSQA